MIEHRFLYSQNLRRIELRITVAIVIVFVEQNTNWEFCGSKMRIHNGDMIIHKLLSQDSGESGNLREVGGERGIIVNGQNVIFTRVKYGSIVPEGSMGIL
jgi:hypothetical protein